MAFGDVLNNPAVDSVAANFGTSPYTITFATTPTSGNLIVVMASGHSGTGGLVTPSGYSVAVSVDDTSLARQTCIYYKISDGTETSVDVQQGQSTGIFGTMYEVEGPFTGSVEDTGTADTNNVTTIPFPTVTSAANESFAIGFCAYNGGTGRYSSVDSGFTAGVDDTVLYSSGGRGATAISKKLSAAGSEGPVITLASAQSAGAVIALFPTGVADTTAPTFSAGPTAGTATETGHTISATLDEDGTIYAVRLADGATAPSSAQVKAGQDSTGSAAPEAKSVSASAGVSADMVFSTGSGTTAYDYYVVAEDDEGAPNLQASPTLVEATTTAPVFSVDSVSGGDQPGESWVFALSNASGSGMTANIGGTALTVTAQTSGSITVTIPDLLTFDGGIHRFSENLTVQIVDGANSDTIDTPITPATGFAQVQMPNPIAGVWAGSTFEAAISPAVLASGDYIHCTAPTDSDPENGIFPEDSTIVYRIMDMSDPTPVWGAAGTMTIEAPVDTTPAAFSFTDATGAEVSTVTESNAITVTGVDSGEDIAVSITGGEYAVSTDSGSTWGAWTSTSTNVQLNHQIKVRGTSSASFSTAVNVALTVGGVSDTFSITTRAADTTLDQFDLGADVTGAEPSAVTTRTFVIAGIDSGETISFTATGDASVSPSTGQLGDTITVTLTAGAFGATVTGGVTSGGVSDSFSIATRAAVTPTIDTQPTNQTVNEGATATFTAAFTNAASIQWYDASDDSALSGETSASLSITTVLADNGNTYYAIATSADSQTAQTNTVTLTVNEVVVVTPPTMPAATTATVAEGSTAVGTYTASSGDAPITYTLGGTDAASFTINGSTGLVAFASAPDYETKSSYSFTVIATNSAGSDSQAVTVTVTNVVEQAPTINTGGSTSVTITEGNSYSDPAWTWGDDVVSGQSVTWSGDTVNSSTTAGTYTRTATATNAFGTTTQDYTITVVAASEFVDAPEIVRVTAGQPKVYIHNGSEIPTTQPMDTNAHIWKQFTLDNLITGETLTGTPTVLINDTVVTEGDIVESMTFREVQTNGSNKIKVRLQGASEGTLYTLTVRYSTTYTPSDDKSQQFYGKRL